MKRGFGNGSKMKYGSNKVTYKGITFDSIHERDFYLKLLQLQREGKIYGLRLQTPFLLIPRTVKTVKKQLKTKIRYDEIVVEREAWYHNDFTFFDKENGVYVCCEYKSKMTSQLADYILRRKLVVRKIYNHNLRGRSKWVFREVIYYSSKNIKINDK